MQNNTTYNPKISVVVAVFNGAATLSRCIKSIFSQTYLNKELIIIDGGSTDASVRIIQENSRHISYWESKPDRGIYHAWNKALSHAAGEWVCFIGSDDYIWEKDVLEKIVPSLEIAEKRNIRLVYGRLASIGKTGKAQAFLGAPWEKTGLMTHQMPPHPGMLHHTSVFRDRGGFDESFRIAADYELLLRELADRDAMFVADVVVAAIQFGGVSCHIKHLPQLIREDIRARKINKIKPVTVYTLKYYMTLLFNTLFY